MRTRTRVFTGAFLTIFAGVFVAYWVVPMAGSRWLSFGLATILIAAAGLYDTARAARRKAMWLAFGAGFVSFGLLLAAAGQ